jgi:type VI secretion system protein ImpI
MTSGEPEAKKPVMALTLRVENETSLPDGGPLSVTIRGKRGIDIGRDSHLDWTLPDPTRFISGKHCEIRFKDGGYWLFDVSTNGTFLNGADHRMQTPHLLRDGDRFVVGNYIVAATVEDEEASAAAIRGAATPGPPASANYQELWVNEGVAAPPIDSKQLKTVERKQSAGSDFLDWAADVPNPVMASAPRPARTRPVDGGAGADADMSWASGPPSPMPPPPPAPAPIPAPRRSARDKIVEPSWDEDREPKESAFAAQAPAASPSPVLAPAIGENSTEILRQLAKSAGLPEDFFAKKDPADVARQLGAVLRLVTENLMQLLSARTQAKRLARSASHTVVQATDNNPLKFAPSAQDALRIMFGPATQSYLDAQRAIEQSFNDLKKHQIKTYSAMQHAVTMLMADFGPQAIEQSLADDRGLTRLLSSRNAKLWETYVARWQAKVRQGEIGPIDAFMLYFAEYYERDGG